MYAGGMTYEEIRSHLAEIYRVEVSKDFISTVTDKWHFGFQRGVMVASRSQFGLPA